MPITNPDIPGFLKNSMQMEITIQTNTLTLDIYGYSAIAHNADYTGTAFKLSGRMWETVKSNNIKNKGKNLWVYDSNNEVFAGVELEAPSTPGFPLEHKQIILPKYAYFKHIGSYKLLPEIGNNISKELKSRGLEKALPYIEIYGHWTNDESKLETELLFNLK